MNGEEPPIRKPDSALASGLKSGSIGLLAVKIGEAVAESWVVPLLVSALPGTSETRMQEIASLLPVVMGGVALALVTAGGTALRDYAAAKGGVFASFIGRFIAP